jgi:hypothetical protein
MTRAAALGNARTLPAIAGVSESDRNPALR